MGTRPLDGLLEKLGSGLEWISETELLFGSLPPYAESRVGSGSRAAPSLGFLSLLLLLKGLDIRHFDFFSFSEDDML